MKLLQRLSGIGRDRKLSVQVTRLFTPLVLAFIVFGMIGFINSSQSTAHASTCSNGVVDSEAMIDYFGQNLGTVQLIKNSCTGLFYGQVVCSTPGSVQLSLASVQVPYRSYNTVNATCNTVGQTIVTAPHAYVQSQDFFAAVADIITSGDGGSGVAITTHA